MRRRFRISGDESGGWSLDYTGYRQPGEGVYQEPLNSSTLTHAISKGTYRPELYNHIICLKTGALFGTASKLGAVAAQVSREMLRHAFEFGACLGEAYQLVDDLHEVMRLGEQADDKPKG